MHIYEYNIYICKQTCKYMYICTHTHKCIYMSKKQEARRPAP